MFKMFAAAVLVTNLLMGQPDNVIQVENNVKAIQVLKESGMKAVSIKSAPFIIPNAKIGGVDEKVEFGDLISLTADIDKSQFSDSLTQVKYQWVVLENGERKKKVEIWPDGSRVFFAVGKESKEYTVILDIDCLFEVRDGDVIKQADINSPDPIVAKIIVGADPNPNPKPPAPPGPDPKPTPDPTFPDGQYGLASFSYQALKADPNLSQAEKAALGGKLAEKFDGVASQIGALATMKDPASIIKATSQAINQGFTELSIDIGKTQLLKTKLSDKVFDLYKTQTIKNADGFQVAWREIAFGLKSFK